jgi:hypothetical protein
MQGALHVRPKTSPCGHSWRTAPRFLCARVCNIRVDSNSSIAFVAPKKEKQRIKDIFSVQREFKGNRGPNAACAATGNFVYHFQLLPFCATAQRKLKRGGNEGPVPIARLQTLKIDEKVLAAST